MKFKLAGHVHLARMIDKCRAVLAGTEGEYIYPCPMDERLMEFVGMTSDQFTAAVKANSTDEEVVKWLEQTAQPHQPAELEEWNQKLLARGPSSPESAARFKKYLAAIDRHALTSPPGRICKTWKKAGSCRGESRYISLSR